MKPSFPTVSRRPRIADLFTRRLALACAGTLALSGSASAATYTWFDGTGLWNFSGNWTGGIPPLADPTTQLIFGGTGGTAYTATDDIVGALQLNILTLNSTATVEETIAADTGNSLNFLSNGATTPTLVQTGTGAFRISAPLTFTNNTTIKLGATAIKGGLITISGNITPVASTTFRVENTTSATTTANSILQVALTGTNGFGATTPIVVNTGAGGATPTGAGAITVLSLNSAFAVGNSSVNSNLAPITLSVNNNTTGPNSATAQRVSINGTPTPWSSILQIGSTIGTAPNVAGITVNGVTYGTGGGQTPIDFSYQLTTSNTPGAGQIRLASTVNSAAGVGFAAFGTGTGTANNRVVGLFATGSTTTLATLQRTQNYGSGNFDHLTFGSPTANGTLILINALDATWFSNAGVPRGFQTVRGVGVVPEANIAGVMNNTGNGAAQPDLNFDGNGGIIFSNPNGAGPAGNLFLRGGAVYMGAADPASTSVSGVFGRNTATFTIGTQNTNVNMALMTYGAGAGVGGSPTITSARTIAVANFTHASVTLGGFTNDYTAFTGNIALNSATPTTFIAGNGIGSNGMTPGTGGRVDFSGVISGTGAVQVSPATVEGENLTAAPTGMAGISLTQSGLVVFNNATNSYAGGTTITSGILSTGPAGTLANGGAPSSIGQSGNTAANLVINGATLRYESTGAVASTDRLFTLGANGATIEASGTNPVTFAGNGANALTYGGSGARTFILGGTNTGANTFAPSIADGTGGATSLTKAGAGSWVVTGASSYTGATAITGGSLTFGPAATRASTAITVAGAATFAAQPGAATNTIGTTGTTLNLNAGAAFSLADGAIGALALNTVGGGAGTVLTLGGTTISPTGLTFDLGSTGADRLIVNNGTVTFAGTPQNNIALLTVGATAPGTLTGIPLLSVPNGTLTLANFSLQTTAVSFGANSYLAALAVSGGNQLVLNLTAASLSFYWKGTTSGSWGVANNFATDPSGATSQVSTPGALNNVFLTANSAANLAQTLGANRTVNSLSFTGTGTTAAGSTVTVAGGGGTLTLNAGNGFADASANNYAAGTGLVVQAGSAAHTLSADVVLAVSQTWQIANSAANPLTVSGAISGGAFNLTKTGAGKLVLTNANTYGGLTTVGNGTLQIGNGSTGAVAGAIALGTTGTLALNLPTATTFTNVLSGTGNLTMNGAGTTIFGAANTFSGTTVIASGTLELGDALALQNSLLDYNNQGGALSFGTLTAAALGGLSGAQNLALTNTTPAAVALTLGSHTATYSGVLSGDGSLIKTGTGTTQTLSGANTYTGATTVTSGVLKAGIATVPGVSGALGVNSAVSLANTANAALDLTGFDTEIGSLTGGGANGGNVIIETATLTVGGDNTSPAVYAGVLSGTGILKKVGGGTLTLSGTNTFTGGTVITGGTISISLDRALGAIPGAFTADNVILDGGTLLSTAGFTLAATRGITVLAGGGTISENNARLSFGATNTISGVGAVSFGGNNQIALASQNTYTGGTTILPGVQILVASNSIGLDDAPDSGPFGTAVVNLAGGTLRASTDNHQTVRNLINLNANTTFVSFGANGDRDLIFTGTTTLVGGTHTLTVNTSPNPAFAGTGVFFNGVIGDGGNNYGLTKAGPGTLVLGGANTYNGVVTVTGGTLAVAVLPDGGVASGLGVTSSDAANVLLRNGTTLAYRGDFDTSTNRRFTIDGTAPGHSAGLGSLGLGAVTFTSTATPAYGLVDETRTLTLSGTNTGLNTLAALLGDNGTGAVSVMKSGAGAWALSNANTYTGATTISGGALVLLNATALPGGVATTGGTSALTLGGGVVGLGAGNFTRALGTGIDQVQFTASGGFAAYGANRTANLGGAAAALVWNSTPNFLTTGNSLLLASAGADSTLTFLNPIDLNGAVRTVQVADGSASLDAVLSGALTSAGGGLTKTGNGTLALNGANTYTGATNVNAGTLRAGSATALGSNSAVTLANVLGVFLDLNGTNLAVGSLAGGGVNGGDVQLGAGTLTAGADNTTTTFAGAITGSGGLTKTGTGTLNLTGTQDYGTLLTSGGTTNVATTFANSTATVNANATTNFATSQTLAALNIGAGAVVTLTASAPFAPFGGSTAVVPEPGTVGLLLIGALGVLGRRRRLAAK